jgi:hypothetical protein
MYIREEEGIGKHSGGEELGGYGDGRYMRICN